MKRNPFAKPQSMPRTEMEWRVAAQVAQASLARVIARRYGLEDDRGRVNEDRCQEFLLRARELGIQPDGRKS